MHIDEYQKWSEKTAIYPKKAGLTYITLGLLSEAGELSSHVKKAIRDDNGILTEEKRQKMIGELGDVCWYLARMAQELGVELTDVLQQNHDKLMSRLERGKIQGSGDDR